MEKDIAVVLTRDPSDQIDSLISKYDTGTYRERNGFEKRFSEKNQAMTFQFFKKKKRNVKPCKRSVINQTNIYFW